MTSPRSEDTLGSLTFFRFFTDFWVSTENLSCFTLFRPIEASCVSHKMFRTKNTWSRFLEGVATTFFPLQRIRCLSSLVPSANLGCLLAAFVGVVVEDLGHKIQVIEETQFIIWSSNRQKVALEFFVLSIGQVFQKPFAAFKSLLSRNKKVWQQI